MKAALFALLLLPTLLDAGELPPDKWAPPEPISTGAALARYPSILNHKGALYIVWSDNRLGAFDLFARVSSGGRWSDEELIFQSGFDSTDPHLCSDSRYLYLIWLEKAHEGEVLFSRFDGERWSDPVRVSPPGSNPSDPRIAVLLRYPKPRLFAFWREGGSILYSTSDDAGLSWSAPRRVDESDNLQADFDVASGTTAVYVAWVEVGPEGRSLKFKPLGDPLRERTLTLAKGPLISRPSLAALEPHLAVAWSSSPSPDEPSQIFLSQSPDFGLSWGCLLYTSPSPRDRG